MPHAVLAAVALAVTTLVILFAAPQMTKANLPPGSMFMSKWETDCSWIESDDCVDTNLWACECRLQNPNGPCSPCPNSQPRNRFHGDHEGYVAFAGSWGGISDKSADARRYVGELQSRNSLHGVAQDVKNFQRSMANLNSTSYATAIYQQGENLRKAAVVKSVKALLSTHHLNVKTIFYSGHGNIDGDWCFEDSTGEIVDYLRYEEMMSLIDENMEGGRVHIIADACHSGAWVYKARAEGRTNIAIFAACRADEFSTEDFHGGLFTKKFLASSDYKGGESYSVNDLMKGHPPISPDQHPQVWGYEFFAPPQSPPHKLLSA